MTGDPAKAGAAASLSSPGLVDSGPLLASAVTREWARLVAPPFVMAGFDPAIHENAEDVDPRDKPGMTD
jgi:hypothetical protein